MVRTVALFALLAGGGLARPATRRVSGLIRDISGAPIPGTTISLPDTTSATWKTNDGGVFRLDEAPGATFRMRVGARGFKERTVEVPAGIDAIDVTLEIGQGDYPVVIAPNWVSPCSLGAGYAGQVEVRGAVRRVRGQLSVGDESCRVEIALAPSDDTVRQHLANVFRALKAHTAVTATVTGVFDPLRRRITVDSISLR